MTPHPLTNFEIQRYYQNEPRFDGLFSRTKLPRKINDGACVINLDKYADTGTHWIALFCNRNEIVYFNSFGVEHVPEEIKEFIGNINVYNYCWSTSWNSQCKSYFTFFSNSRNTKYY